MAGGAREGAGRKAKGLRKKVSVNLPPADWEYVEEILRQKNITMSDYFRGLVDRTLTDDLQRLNYDCEEDFA